MPNRYPIVNHRQITAKSVASLSPGAEEVLVLTLADGRHLLLGDLANAQREEVVAVTTVDVRKDVELSVRARLRERRVSFGILIRVELRCTVVDPVAVATARHSSAVQDLQHHLAEVTLRIARDNRHHAGYDGRILRNLQNRLNPPAPTALAPSRRPGRRPHRDIHLATVPGLRFVVRTVDSGHDALPRTDHPSSDTGGYGSYGNFGGGELLP
jgi:hypothetical protein